MSGGLDSWERVPFTSLEDLGFPLIISVLLLPAEKRQAMDLPLLIHSLLDPGMLEAPWG